jgi:hypothetical protein
MKKLIIFAFIALLVSGCNEPEKIQVEKAHYAALVQNMSESRDIFKEMLLDDSMKPDIEIVSAYASNALLWLSTQYSDEPYVEIDVQEICRVKEDLTAIKMRYFQFLESYSPDEQFVASKSFQNVEALFDGLNLGCAGSFDQESPSKAFEEYYRERTR